MTTQPEALQTPLPDLLDKVPNDLVLGIPDNNRVFPSHTNIPIGKLAQQAATELRRQHDEIEQLKAERDNACKLVVEMHNAATGSTEGPRHGVVEDIAKLKAERDALLGILKDALSHVEWSEKIIYPFVGEDFQSWRLTVFLGVPLSESDKSPEAALERTISAAIDAARSKT